jgi:hypothetical protein
VQNVFKTFIFGMYILYFQKERECTSMYVLNMIVYVCVTFIIQCNV